MIGLKAVDCNTGDVPAEAQEQAEDKEAVLKALGNAAISLRSRLGEPLSTVQKYAVGRSDHAIAGGKLSRRNTARPYSALRGSRRPLGKYETLVNWR